MLRTTSISKRYKECRRDRRYAAPRVLVAVGSRNYVARDWSLGGFLLEEAPSFDVGARVDGELAVAGSSSRFAITAETVRHDKQEQTLACRFVDPPPGMIEALDSAVASRMFGRRSARAKLGLALAGTLLLAPGAGLAAGTGMLVPGAAPPLEFHLNFPSLLIEPLGAPAAPANLQISLTSPDKSVLHFVFSPRSRFAMSTDPETGTSRTYAGMSWNLFDNGGFFGNLSLAGSLTRPGAEELNRRALGPPLALHSTFEFGYQLGNSHSLTLSLDRATTPDLFSDHNELNNLHLRYGLKF